MKNTFNLLLCLLLPINLLAQNRCTHSQPDKYALYIKNFEKDSIDGFISIPVILIVNDTIPTPSAYNIKVSGMLNDSVTTYPYGNASVSSTTLLYPGDSVYLTINCNYIL